MAFSILTQRSGAGYFNRNMGALLIGVTEY